MKQIVRRFLRSISKLSVFRSCMATLGRCGLFPYIIANRFPAEGTFDVKIDNDHKFSYASSLLDNVGRSLLWNGAGGHEPETLEFLKPHLQKAKTFIDIGANTGHFSLYACAVNPDIHVHAFEPVPQNFESFENNLRINNYQNRCQTHAKAVSSKTGTVQFHIPFETYPKSASLDPEGFRDVPGELVEVESVRLDEYIAEHDLQPDIIKIDVEGFEHDVLKGAAQYFSTGQRPMIVFECHPDGPVSQIMAALSPLDYELYHLSLKGPVKYDVLNPDQNSDRAWNWVATQASLDTDKS